ncbi:MAG: serpin family protein [Solirubrobacteraceae bacterium]
MLRPFQRLTLAACLAATAVAVLSADASGGQRRQAASATARAAGAETTFALSLLDRLAPVGGNVIYSPYSIDVALAMADAGAAGQTAAQIDRVLAAPSHAAASADAAALVQALAAARGSEPGAPTLRSADALWTQTGLALEHPFVATLGEFGAPPRSTDFAAAPQTALAAINAWVAAHTSGLIPALLGPGAVSSQTAFVLANAIYLKAHWSSPFAPSLTAPGPFHLTGGQVVRVPFMHQQDTTYGYAQGNGYQAVDLPYRSSTLSLLAILPHGSLAGFEHSLNADTLAAVVTALKPHAVTLAMPKIDLSSQIDLDQPLELLGMRDAFGPAADFSALTRQRALNISLVEHAAVLKVDEQGTVAAGATAIVGPTAVERPPVGVVTVAFDHPFLLVLRDDASGTILFVARVADPSRS